jgi:hypothetical protein
VDRRSSYTGSTTRWEKMWYKVVVGIDTCCSIRSKIEGVKRRSLGRGYNGKGVGGKMKGSKPGSEVLLHSSRNGEQDVFIVSKCIVVVLEGATKTLKKFAMLGEVVEET